MSGLALIIIVTGMLIAVTGGILWASDWDDLR